MKTMNAWRVKNHRRFATVNVNNVVSTASASISTKHCRCRAWIQWKSLNEPSTPTWIITKLNKKKKRKRNVYIVSAAFLRSNNIWCTHFNEFWYRLVYKLKSPERFFIKETSHAMGNRWTFIEMLQQLNDCFHREISDFSAISFKFLSFAMCFSRNH